jgi:transcriptional regulator with XRE-family HTH domain
VATQAFNLREWRKRHEVRLEDLHDLTGVSIATLSRVERGLTKINPLDQIKIARVVGVRVRDLFPGAGR